MMALSGVRSSCDMLARNSRLVPVRRSRARGSCSWISLNRRAFWIAITAWSAKVLSRASSFVAERLRRIARDLDRADAASFPQHRREGDREAAAARGDAPQRLRRLRIGERRRRNGRPGARGSRAPSPCLQRPRERAGKRAFQRCSQCLEIRLAAACRRRRSGRCRARSPRTDARSCRGSCRTPAAVSATELLMTLEHLRGRGLLLERLLGLVEQAHVLDRDHRLVGEGLQQPDLLGGERPWHAAARARDRADRPGRRAASAPPGTRPKAEARLDAARTSGYRVERRDHVVRQCSDAALEDGERRADVPIEDRRAAPSSSLAVARARSRAHRRAACRRRPAATPAACRSPSSRWQLPSDRLEAPAARRSSDPLIDLQHLGGGGLLLERLLRLVEQARVLDRDHRLVGEGLQQPDLLVAEASRLAPADR